MKKKTSTFIFISALVAVLITIPAFWSADTGSVSYEQTPAPQPTLTVTVTSPREARLPVKVSANGNIMAWQETSIGTELNGLRLLDVKVDVGDKVHRGQVLAVFASDTIAAELAQSRAAVSEADVALTEAAANADRARALQGTGALSKQQIHQSINTERAAKARLDAARALEKIQRLRLEQTKVVAPDDGVISARAATVGAVVSAGEELFRLIRQGRIEWRAEVAASELAQLKPGQEATVIPVGGEPIRGTLRMVGPTVDPHTGDGLVYVDLPSNERVRVGMFARGEFEIASDNALTLPQSAVLLRDGFSYVLRVDAASHVTQTKIKTGRRIGDSIEILEGIDKSVKVVAAGGGFLGDGDLVRVVADNLASPGSTPFLNSTGQSFSNAAQFSTSAMQKIPAQFSNSHGRLFHEGAL